MGYKEDIFLRQTTLSYFHPFFTYHIVAQADYRVYPEVRESLPYSIAIYNSESVYETTDFPAYVKEKDIQLEFCNFIKCNEPNSIAPFLNYQFNSYLIKKDSIKDPKAFLEYVITTIENVNPNWNRIQNYDSLNEVGNWVLNHPAYDKSLQARVTNLARLSPWYDEIKKAEKYAKRKEFVEWVRRNVQHNIPSILDKRYNEEVDKPALLNRLMDLLLDYNIPQEKWTVEDQVGLEEIIQWMAQKLEPDSINLKKLKAWCKQKNLITPSAKMVNTVHSKKNTLSFSLESEVNETAKLNAQKEYARECLEHLSMERKGQKIMSEKDYQRMLDYTLFFIENKTFSVIEPIYRVGISKNHLLYTFYLIHTNVNGMGADKDLFIDFLSALFPFIYKNPKNPNKSVKRGTINTKFSIKPTYYTENINIIMGKIGK